MAGLTLDCGERVDHCIHVSGGPVEQFFKTGCASRCFLCKCQCAFELKQPIINFLFRLGVQLQDEIIDLAIVFLSVIVADERLYKL